MKKVQGRLMKQKDKRSKLIDEILNGMKILKLYNWEDSFKGLYKFIFFFKLHNFKI